MGKGEHTMMRTPAWLAGWTVLLTAAAFSGGCGGGCPAHSHDFNGRCVCDMGFVDSASGCVASLADGDEAVDPDGDEAEVEYDIVEVEVPTNLKWQTDTSGYVHLDTAAAYCTLLYAQSQRDWRVPTITELRTLVTGCTATAMGGPCNVHDSLCVADDCRLAICDGCDRRDDDCYRVPGLDGGCSEYWSSTAVPGLNTRWSVNFINARVHHPAVNFPVTYLTRCVRVDGERPPYDPSLHWVAAPAGSFLMGCSEGDTLCAGNEKPAHRVSLNAFEILATEVTREQYLAFVKEHGKLCGDQDCIATGDPALYYNEAAGHWEFDAWFADHPVTNVTREGAAAFCSWAGGSLPSEAQWEYAARGGTVTAQNCGDDDACLDRAAFYTIPPFGELPGDLPTFPVAEKTANAWGLYDTHGNAEEWVADCWHESYDGAPADGAPWNDDCIAGRGVVRDHSAYDTDGRAQYRVSERRDKDSQSHAHHRGFRCTRPAPAANADGDLEE